MTLIPNWRRKPEPPTPEPPDDLLDGADLPWDFAVSVTDEQSRGTHIRSVGS